LIASSLLPSLALVVIVAARARAQAAPEAPSLPAAGEHRDAHHDAHHDEHGHLHFSHPLVTESPSPDTKLRLDYLWTRTGASTDRTTEHGVRVEGEFAFNPGLSLALTVPYVWRSATGASATQSFGNAELSLKAASVRWGEQGLLVGGGLSAGLPTGDDARGIGTSQSVELEPFVDLGLQRGGFQLVGFGHYGTTVHNPSGVATDRELAFDGSLLHPVTRLAEALLEVEVARPLGDAASATATSIAPGIKLYPFPNRSLMAGVSALIGLGGEQRHGRGLLASAFYHF